MLAECAAWGGDDERAAWGLDGEAASGSDSVASDEAAKAEPAAGEGVFAEVRDYCAGLARSLAMVPIDAIQQAIDEGDRALALGPILDPTLWQRGAAELETQLRLLRAVLRFRLVLEGFRPEASS